jgi:hypothetical protein
MTIVAQVAALGKRYDLSHVRNSVHAGQNPAALASLRDPMLDGLVE